MMALIKMISNKAMGFITILMDLVIKAIGMKGRKMATEF